MWWVILWYVTGVASAVYFWAAEFGTYETKNVPLSLVMGLGGPISFLICWSTYDGPSRTLWRRR